MATESIPCGMSLRGRETVAGKLAQFLKAAEPWYDWGNTFVSRLDETGEGPGRFVELQWLGFNITLFFGRTPKAEGTPTSPATRKPPRVIGNRTNMAAASAALSRPLPSSLFEQRLDAFEQANAAYVRANMFNVADEVRCAAAVSASNAYQDLIATPPTDALVFAKKAEAVCRWNDGCEMPWEELAVMANDARIVLAAGGAA